MKKRKSYYNLAGREEGTVKAVERDMTTREKSVTGQRRAMNTMRDIADRAGVSRATVSYVLNDKHSAESISEDTRRRVLQAASEMGYRRNEMARAIVTGTNSILGFLIPALELEAEVVQHVLAGVLAEADERNYSIQVIRLTEAMDRRAIERCIELRPVGVTTLYVRGQSLAYVHEEMGRYAIPVAVLDSSFPQTHGSRILSDDKEGCCQAIEHLASLGHRNIAFIAGNPVTGVSVLREEGYRLAMAAQGLPIPQGYVVDGQWLPDRVEEVTRHLFSPENGLPSPTAVFCADDKAAMVVCRTLSQMGLRVPKDVSVIGFADLTMAAYGNPPLTTVAQPFQDMGRAAVSRLLAVAQQIRAATNASGPVHPYEELLPTRLVIRESTARAKR